MAATINNKRGIIYSYIIIALFLILVSYRYFTGKKDEKSLLSNMAITSGTTYGFPFDSRKQAVSVEYWYIIEGKKYTRLTGAAKIFVTQSSPFTRKNFPVVYDSTNPVYSHILIDPADFLKYRVRFPDSLNWVLSYFNNTQR